MSGKKNQIYSFRKVKSVLSADRRKTPKCARAIQEMDRSRERTIYQTVATIDDRQAATVYE